MNIRTFYTIFYRHRFEKASLIRKMYLALILPFKYLYNYFHLDKKKKPRLFFNKKFIFIF